MEMKDVLRASSAPKARIGTEGSADGSSQQGQQAPCQMLKRLSAYLSVSQIIIVGMLKCLDDAGFVATPILPDTDISID